MPPEIPIPPYIPEALKEKYIVMETERLKDVEVFEAWWKQLTEERQDKYQNLRIFSTDYPNGTRKEEPHPHHLRRCKLLLEIAERMITPDGKKIYPVAMSIHGEHPVIFFDLEEVNNHPGARNRDEMSCSDDRNDPNVWCDIDTTSYGFPVTGKGIMGYELQEIEWNEVDEWMKSLTIN